MKRRWRTLLAGVLLLGAGLFVIGLLVSPADVGERGDRTSCGRAAIAVAVGAPLPAGLPAELHGDCRTGSRSQVGGAAVVAALAAIAVIRRRRRRVLRDEVGAAAGSPPASSPGDPGWRGAIPGALPNVFILGPRRPLPSDGLTAIRTVFAAFACALVLIGFVVLAFDQAGDIGEVLAPCPWPAQ